MVKSLPYLPTERSMSIKRCISLKPRQQCQLTRTLFCSKSSRFRTSGKNKTSDATRRCPSSIRMLSDSMPSKDNACNVSDPRCYQAKPDMGYRKVMPSFDGNIYVDVVGEDLPYLPSPEAKDHDHLPSIVYRLKPRSSSNQILAFI